MRVSICNYLPVFFTTVRDIEYVIFDEVHYISKLNKMAESGFHLYFFPLLAQFYFFSIYLKMIRNVASSGKKSLSCCHHTSISFSSPPQLRIRWSSRTGLVGQNASPSMSSRRITAQCPCPIIYGRASSCTRFWKEMESIWKRATPKLRMLYSQPRQKIPRKRMTPKPEPQRDQLLVPRIWSGRHRVPRMIGCRWSAFWIENCSHRLLSFPFPRKNVKKLPTCFGRWISTRPKNEVPCNPLLSRLWLVYLLLTPNFRRLSWYVKWCREELECIMAVCSQS